MKIYKANNNGPFPSISPVLFIGIAHQPVLRTLEPLLKLYTTCIFELTDIASQTQKLRNLQKYTHR
jgi:hypothetical protein